MSAITFNRAEVSDYYSARVPHLKQGRTVKWRGPCPIHHGTDDNFEVYSESGRWRCYSQCGGRDGDIFNLEALLTGADFPTCKAEVFRLVGRSMPDYRRGSQATGNSAGTPPARPTRSAGKWKEIARYPYVGHDGRLLYHVVRYLKPNGQKTFVHVRPSGVDAAGTGGLSSGGTVKGLDAGKYVPDRQAARATGKPAWRRAGEGRGQSGQEVPLNACRRVPYRLPSVLKAETVYLPEGEKDVHTLEEWGLVASCNSGGSGNTRLYEEWIEFFRDRKIVIVADNDHAGRKHAAAKAEILLPVATSVRIVELPDLPEKGDVTDWKRAGGIREQFLKLVDEAPVIDAAALSGWRARWGLGDDCPRHQARVAYDWPKPEPIQCELPPVEVFSGNLLPDSFRPLVLDVAERMQVPMDYPAVAMVICLAGVVNRRAVIQPKANDTGWVVVPNLWGGIIAPPGFMKSPVIQAVTRPLNQIQTEWRHEHGEALKDYARAKEEHELRFAAWKEEFKRASKGGKPAPDRPANEPEEPKLQRLIVNDATFEALHQTMSENPAGILMIRDELTGWLSRLDQEQYGTERGFALQAWNGDSPYDVTRIGRGNIHVEGCCMSVLGGIQPSRLRSYLVDAVKDGPSNDGLIQRFQVPVWPDTPTNWCYVDRNPDAASEEMAAQVFRRLAMLDPHNPLRFRFDPAAQELFVEWLADLESKLRSGDAHPALVSHLSKYRSLMPSLALLFELADRAAVGFDGFVGSDPGKSQNFWVSLEHTKQAAAWCEYLESHARRIYSCIVTPQLRAARELAKKIKQRNVGADGFFSCRDVYLKGWSGLDSPEAVKQAAEVLKDAGWLREFSTESGPLGGRPSYRYEVNPGVWE